MSFKKSFLAAATTSILAAAGSAQAQTCASDRDCPQGLACNTSTVVVAPEPSCEPNRPCPKPDASATPMTVMTCGPKSCAADADCGAGMVCYEEKTMACSGGTAVACPSDMPCDAAPPQPPECTTTITRVCAFKWQLPCNKDTDCGAGFTCKPTEIGSCSGSAGGGSTGSGGGSTGSGATRPGIAAPPSDAGAAPPPMPPPPMCMTMTSYPGYCQPTATTCQTDADCPMPWKCAAGAYDTPVMSDPPPGSGAPRPPSTSPDAGAPPPKMCVSPYGGYGGPVRGGKDETGAPAPGMGGGTTGDTHTPTTPPTQGGAASSKANSAGGCAVGGGAGSGLGLLLVAAVGLIRRRRRR